MRIWIDQGGAYGNLGDEAMLQVAMRRLRRIFPGCRFVVPALSDRPLPEIGPYERVDPPVVLTRGLAKLLNRRSRSLFGRLEQWGPANRLGMRLCDHGQWMPPYLRQVRDAVVESIDSCDFYYAAGAANLHDWSIQGNIVPRAWAVRRFAMAGKPVVINGQTVGPLRTPVAARMVREMAMHADLFSLRDPSISADWMTRVGVPAGRFQIVGDEAFQLEPAPGDVLDEYLARHDIGADEPFVLAHVRHTDYLKSISPNHPALLQTVRNLADRYRVLLCPMSYGRHSGQDAVFAQQVADAAGLPGRIIAGGPIKDARLARGLVGRCRRVVALSYHLQVFAIAAGRPFICLASGDYYRHKCEALQAWLDPAVRLTIDLDAPTDPAAVCDRLENIQDEFRDCLTRVSADILKRQDAFLDRIRDTVTPGQGKAMPAIGAQRAAA